MDHSWINVVALTRIAEFLRHNAIEPADFLRRVDAPLLSVLETDLWVERELLFRMCGDLADISGDEFAGLHVTKMGHLSLYGRWGEGIMRAQDLGSAIRYAAENISLIETNRCLSLTMDDGRARLQSDFVGTIREDPHHILDATLVSLRRILNQACVYVPAEAHMPFEQPRDTSEYERLLGPDLVFGAESPAFVFDADALSLPLRVQRPAAQHGRRYANPTAIVLAVVRAVDEVIEFERPCALAVASSLGMTLRTMQRNLKVWGTTFEEILTEYLLLHATHDLRAGKRSVTDVAFSLGYSDSGHFTRAFKRWTGQTPRDFQVAEEIPVSMLQSLILETDLRIPN